MTGCWRPVEAPTPLKHTYKLRSLFAGVLCFVVVVSGGVARRRATVVECVNHGARPYLQSRRSPPDPCQSHWTLPPPPTETTDNSRFTSLSSRCAPQTIRLINDCYASVHPIAVAGGIMVSGCPPVLACSLRACLSGRMLSPTGFGQR